MVKRYSNLYAKIRQPLNLWNAYKQAARGKRSQPAVAAFEFDLEANLIELEDELNTETYTPGGYKHFTIQSRRRCFPCHREVRVLWTG